jgi:hypothetical protein
MLSDAEIARLTPAQRRRLIRRLSKSLTDVAGPPEKIRRVRVARLSILIAAVLVLIPWIVYLALTLPERYVTTHWELTWVGFDVLLLALFVTTAVLGLMRRQLIVLSAFATGVLLVCDAWFDVTTAGPHDRPLSLLSAVLVELPMAVLLIGFALRFVRVQAERMWLMPPARHLWQVPLQFDEPVDGDAQSPRKRLSIRRSAQLPSSATRISS